MEVARLPPARRARKLTAVALLLLMAPPLWVAPSASASPGGGWSSAVDLKSSGGYAQFVDVAADRVGNAMAVYVDYDGSAYTAYARRFVGGLGWQPEVAIGASGYYQALSVASDPVGNAFAAWAFWNGSAYTTEVARYAVDWGWSPAQTPSPMNYDTYIVETAMDGQGAGYVASGIYDGSYYQLRGARLDANETLSPTFRLDNATNGVDNIQVKASAATGAIYMWRSYNGTNYDLYSQRHNGTTWQSRPRVELKGGSLDYPSVGLDDNGNALAVWQQDVFGSYVWYATQTATGGWTAQQYALTSNFGSIISVSPGGAAVMTSILWNGSAYVIAASRYTPGLGFGSPIAGNDAISTYPSYSIDVRGRVVAVYLQYTGSIYRARSSSFSGTTWGPGAFLELDSVTDGQGGYAVAAMSDGRAMGVWMRSQAASTQPRASLYTGADTTPPYVRVTYPLSGFVTDSTYITVAGWTEPGADVTVNGFAAMVFPTGYFEVTLTLTEGYHYLSARSQDASGNIGYSNYIFVTYMSAQRNRDAEIAQANRSGWQDVIQLDPVKYSGAWWPQVAMDRYGNGVMVWYENAYGNTHVYASLYVNGTGWTVPALFQLVEGELWGAPRLAMDDGGNFTITWTTQANDYSWARVYATFYTRLYGWAGVYRIDSAERYAYWSDVAVDNQMRHFMVWQQRDEVTGNWSIWSRYLNTSGYFFGLHGRIDTAVGSNDLPRIAFDASGLGYVSFRNWNASGSAYNLSLVRFNGASWNGTQTLELVPGDQWVHPLSADPGGNLTIATRTWNGTQQNYSAGRFWANGSWSGNQLVWGNSWDWDPEVIADPSGRAFIAFTASTAGNGSDAYVAVAQAGALPSAAVAVDGTITNSAGGPKLSTGRGGTPARVHFDEWFNGIWHPQMREYNAANGTWGPIIQLSPGILGGHIPDVAAMPDGGYMVVYIEDNTTLGLGQAVARRYGPVDLTPPAITITSPTNGTLFGVAFADVRGTAEIGARVWVNNIEVVVAANGSWATVVPLVNGSNTITARAQDINGNLQNRTASVTFADPALALIANLTAQNLALQAAFVAANNSLWAALAGQNASLLGQLAAQNASLAAAIASGDAALLAQLLAQNASLAAAIAAGDASLAGAILAGDAALQAALLAQNATLATAIAAGDAALLADLIAQNASLVATIANVNSALLASMAAQNASLLANIASTNASLLAKLAAQNASTAAALANLNATLLAQLASQDAALTQLIADTNQTLLAELAAQNDALTDLIASTNTSLLASLAAQNSDLLARIASTNSTLLAQLAAQNATLWAKLTADNGALWNSLNATNGVNSNQNSTLAATQADVDAAQAQAASASMMGMIGALLGVAGIAVAGVAILLSRKRPPPSMEGTAAPPEVGHVEVVDVAPAAPPPAAPAPRETGHGHSMAAQGELSSTEA